MHRTILLTFTLAATLIAARPTDYSADMVMLENGQVVQTLKLYVSGQKSRVEGFAAGQLGRIVTIARKDRGVLWTLYLDRSQFTEQTLAAGNRSGKPDLSDFDLASMKTQMLGRETVLGHACTKLRATFGTMPNGQALTGTVWMADRLELPIRLDVMGMVQENRNIRVAAQPGSLFEIPNGYTKTMTPIPAGKIPRRIDERVRPPQGGWGSAPTTMSTSTQTTATAAGPAWKDNTNRVGADYRVIDMATSDPTACKAACDGEAQCKSWTLVKPESPGGMGYCYLKGEVPPETAEDCCISGVKGGTNTAPSNAAWKDNTDRAGDDYRMVEMATSDPTACKALCDKEARCRAWTLAKPAEAGGMGACWLKEKAPPEAWNSCCVSGVKGGTQAGSGKAWKNNINRYGGDYKSIDMATSDPTACKAACDSEAQCKSWTLVKPGEPGGMGTCWLKDIIPPETRDDCCVSGVK
ncbi:MAG TPA: PAN domain-containing protein [Bryobacteraceae bacterium]|nr:PAN domain-containing protein [Bryobacteraceae bacterium]HPT25684.1 PAN domain-containing protein [Bryobacteraceae bacterium]